MRVSAILSSISNGGYNSALRDVYGDVCLAEAQKRCISLCRSFIELYGDLDAVFVSVPGRTEISGNHTDHNNGCVLAASVNIDILALAAQTNDSYIRIKSEGYREEAVHLRGTISPQKVRKNTSAAIMAGVVDYFAKNGFAVGGFCACMTSKVASGSGLSSSAAFEVAVANILNYLYNGMRIPPMTLAMAGKYAENVFFGKPCGLMDQAACAHGGLLYLDFASNDAPISERYDFNIGEMSMFIVNVGAGHADLTDDYAAVPAEMKSCAALLGKETLRECDEATFVSRIPYMRGLIGDRAIMRALHFFDENKRVVAQRDCIKNGDIDGFMRLVKESGDSSYKYLQNVFTLSNPKEQALALALCVTERMGFVCRVHGGGFAGTIQAYVPYYRCDEYRHAIEKIFGVGSCLELSVRPYGAIAFDGEKIYECGR